jgi:hypothetical protein
MNASGPEFSRVDLEIESAGFVVKDDLGECQTGRQHP